ncbi:MAG: glycosyltransferase [Alphaproteobacteria bacterium]|nr:glycosyltransferase [Alphaproteobacteria bacterium]
MTDTPDVLITYYPLTSDTVAEIEAHLGNPVETLVVSNIRGRGTLDILRQMRAMSFDRIFLPCPSRDWVPFLPMLRLIALLPRSNRIILLGPNFEQTRLGWPGAALAAVKLGWHSVSAGLAMALSTGRLRKLAAAPRQTVTIDGDSNEVLYLKTNLWTGVMAGGSVSHTAGVIQGLSENGLRVTYVSPSEAPELAGIPALSNLRVPLPYGYTYPREVNNYRYDSRLRRWTLHYNRRRPAFLYHRLSLGSSTAVSLARRLGVPLVLEYNGSEVWIADHWGSRLKSRTVAVLAEDICLHHAHLIVTVSEPLREELIGRGIEPERIHVQPNGFDQKRFDPTRFSVADRAEVRRRLGIPVDAVVATFVGTFGPWHGAEILAQALIQLAQSRPGWLEQVGLHLLFIGDGMSRAEVEAQVQQAGLGHRCTFSGLVPPHQAPAMLAASDIFVAPHVPNADGTEFFGSPTKLFEYMGMGRPTIASALGQISEMMAGSPPVARAADMDQFPDSVGILIEPANVDHLADALVHAASHPDWRARVGANARARALASFTWSHHVQGVLGRLRRDVPTRCAPVSPQRHTVLVNAVHAKSGGGITYLANILPRLAAHPQLRIEVAIQSDQERQFRDMAAGLTLHVLPSVSRLATVYWQEQIDIPRLAARIGATAVFSPANYGPIRGKGNILLLRNAFEVATMDRRLDKRLYWLAVKLTTEWSFRASGRAIVVSRHAAENFLEAFGMEGDSRLDVIHHGVSPLFSPPAAEGLRISHGLLAVSDIYVQKNFETLLKAVAILSRTRPDISLQIAGRPLDDGYFSRLKAMVVQLGIEDHVTFLGGKSQAEVAELYRQAQIFVFPSLVETFGNPLLEAMASGLPVVCSRAAALPEVAGPAALYSKPGDPADMAATIDRLLDDPHLWRQLSQAGIERARGFTWDSCAEATASVLLDVARA